MKTLLLLAVIVAAIVGGVYAARQSVERMKGSVELHAARTAV